MLISKIISTGAHLFISTNFMYNIIINYFILMCLFSFSVCTDHRWLLAGKHHSDLLYIGHLQLRILPPWLDYHLKGSRTFGHTLHTLVPGEQVLTGALVGDGGTIKLNIVRVTMGTACGRLHCKHGNHKYFSSDSQQW